MKRLTEARRRMSIIDINEAANLFHMSVEGLRRKAKSGVIPATKPGKCWVFVEEDLVAYLRSQYVNKDFLSSQKQIKRGNNTCQYTDVKIQKYGGSATRRKAVKEYESLLGRA